MFSNFRNVYSNGKVIINSHVPLEKIPEILSNCKGVQDFFESFSGKSFCDGLYRIHSISDIEIWNSRIELAYPSFSNRFCCFGYDWLGRQFSVDVQRLCNQEPLVLMFDPGTGEVLEIPVNFQEFHENELIDYAEECLAKNFFLDWRANSKSTLLCNQCAGYKVPLFLGGSDEINNLEIIDLDVYWHITTELLRQVEDLPVGTNITQIELE